jgi:hypothetical protein
MTKTQGTTCFSGLKAQRHPKKLQIAHQFNFLQMIRFFAKLTEVRRLRIATPQGQSGVSGPVLRVC